MTVGMLMAAALFSASLPAAVIVRPAANMYAQPTREADVVSQALYGHNVEVLEERAGWARVRTADQYSGWMPDEFFRRSEKPYAASGTVAQVSSLFANVYREASVTKHEPLVTVPFEARLEALAEPAGAERWVQVRLPDGRSGWVQGGDVDFHPRKLALAEMIEFSRRFQGLPYLWGGTSTLGYDCSGLMQMLYRRLDILLPRDAGPQAAWEGLRPVDRHALAAGDLLYFGRSPDKITHTGMYLGHGQFINATTWQKPMVQIDNLNDPHWQALLVACRRLK